MEILTDIHNRQVRFTEERWEHIRTEHPEMSKQFGRIQETLLSPDRVVKSRIDPEVELFYRHYKTTPVTQKYLCVVVKTLSNDSFIITAYFTDTIKRGEILWERK
ncbi:MAG: hypothetical protein J7M03_02320 [Candidatus Desulfofervidaceae bacterium]|nr:hypothetical protein [Candidatus Desulfofervidaceae bacterium]MDL1970161.1 hypothetical protein [Candidatus Desulfofervidaceae bacterium]